MLGMWNATEQRAYAQIQINYQVDAGRGVTQRNRVGEQLPVDHHRGARLQGDELALRAPLSLCAHACHHLHCSRQLHSGLASLHYD